jgi:WD40 repeat protein
LATIVELAQMSCDAHGGTSVTRRPSPIFAGICLVIFAMSFFSCRSQENTAGIRLRINKNFAKAVELPTISSPNQVWAVDFNADGTLVAVGTGFLVEVWEWKELKQVAELPLPKGVTPIFGGHSLQFSPDGSLLAVNIANSAEEPQLQLFNSRDWSVAANLRDGKPGTVTAFAFSPDGRTLFAVSDLYASKGRSVTAYDVETAASLWDLELGLFRPVAISVSPDGQFIAVAGSLSVVASAEVKDLAERIRSFKYQKQIKVIDVKRRSLSNTVITDALGPMGWSPDGGRLVITGAANLEMFDTRNWIRLSKIEQPNLGHVDVKYSPDGLFLAESDANGQGTGHGFKVWDSSRQTLVKSVGGNVWSISFSRDSKLLAVGEEGRTSIWKLN